MYNIYDIMVKIYVKVSQIINIFICGEISQDFVGTWMK